MTDKKKVHWDIIPLTDSESEYGLGGLVSSVDARDYIAEAIYPETDAENLPETLDLRPHLRPIRSQGKYGTCAAHTAICIKEYHEKKDVNLNADMSPQFVYNHRENYPDEGMFGRNVMAILLKQGSCLEKTYPYKTQNIATEMPKEAIEEGAKYKIKSYAQVNTIAATKVALYKNGPCYISFPCYNHEPRFWKPASQNEKLLGGHAVTIVGYNEEGFIIRNSWGSSWAEKGYTNYGYGDFGTHYEIWTTIDEKSVEPIRPKEEKPMRCQCRIV